MAPKDATRRAAAWMGLGSGWSTVSVARQAGRAILRAAAVFAIVAVSLTACYLLAWSLVTALLP